VALTGLAMNRTTHPRTPTASQRASPYFLTINAGAHPEPAESGTFKKPSRSSPR